MHDVAAPRDRAYCSGAVQTTIDTPAAIAAQGPWPVAVIGVAVRTYQFPSSSHGLIHTVRWAASAEDGTDVHSYI
jgi:hypothetical protein